MSKRVINEDDRRFGQHLRRCRRARGLTQETLAEQSDLSPDTIRRLEHGSFSPSLATLRKVCRGLRLDISTLFLSYSLGEPELAREVLDAVASLSAREQRLLLRLVHVFKQVSGDRLTGP